MVKKTKHVMPQACKYTSASRGDNTNLPIHDYLKSNLLVPETGKKKKKSAEVGGFETCLFHSKG